MKMRYIIGLTAFAAALAAGVPHANSQDGGMLSTLPKGDYQCGLPGDAGGAAVKAVKDAEFHVGAASTYYNDKGRGVYILKGNVLTFTRGPKKGERFRRVGSHSVQQMGADGGLTKLMCTRIGGIR